ncbi:ras-related protein Rab-39B [Lates japonicus]|uniref:Ras-related protein Rab-39B n=1 Tax=Lates japonicus TaxID=270547 RepID=A0AAD3NPT9_LATJO|nr:ras-related protein Rab-39B [Lates japonicus]
MKSALCDSAGQRTAASAAGLGTIDSRRLVVYFAASWKGSSSRADGATDPPAGPDVRKRIRTNNNVYADNHGYLRKLTRDPPEVMGGHAMSGSLPVPDRQTDGHDQSPRRYGSISSADRHQGTHGGQVVSDPAVVPRRTLRECRTHRQRGSSPAGGDRARKRIERLQIWDTAERHDWLETQATSNPTAPIFPVNCGHKINDLGMAWVTRQEAEKLAGAYGMRYIETSARDAINVEHAFTELTRDIFALVRSGDITIQEGWEGVKSGFVPNVVHSSEEVTKSDRRCLC